MSQQSFFNPLTAKVQIDLQKGFIKSTDLVHAYLAHIELHNGRLHAVISSAPLPVLLDMAQRMDEERAAGKVCGALHGIPILLKEAIATHPSLGLTTSIGSFALLDRRPS